MSPSDDVLALLDEAWDDEVGFLGKLRAGGGDAEGGAELSRISTRVQEAVAAILGMP